MAIKKWFLSPEQERFVIYLPTSSRFSHLQFTHSQNVVVFEYPFPALTGKNDRGMSALAVCVCIYIYL